MKVLSLFDGMACGLQALKEAGIPVEIYYASEIDKYAIQIAKKNHPEIIELGDVKNWREWNLGDIDMVIGGSPCQDLSIAGKRAGLDGARSGLFRDMVDIIAHYKPKYFLLENVASMSKENKQIITEAMGVEPILINSALLTAQNRKRLYWTNIPGITQPEDNGIILKDVLGQYDGSVVLKKEQYNKVKGLGAIYSFGGYVLKGNSKYPTIVKSYGVISGNSAKIECDEGYRILTPIECERLQGLPDNYTEGVSNTQRYKMIGNGQTIPIISWIFRFTP